MTIPVDNQKYAFVTVETWQDSLAERWPDAILYGNYRLLVFAGSDLTPLETEYIGIEFKHLNSSDTIKAMENNEQPPFILNLDDAREVCAYFTPDQVDN